MKRPIQRDHAIPDFPDIIDPKTYISALEKYADHLELLVEHLHKKLKEAYTDGFSDDRFDFDLENYIETPL